MFNPVRSSTLIVSIAAALASAAAYLTPVYAQSEVAKLLPADGAQHHYFGFSVAVSGDAALIAAPGDNQNGWQSGAAYVFRSDGTSWVQEAKLLAQDGAEKDCFAYSVAFSDSTAIIGAVDDDDNGPSSGSVYVFRFDGLNWLQEAKLLAADGASEDWFGCSVATNEDTAVVGAFRDDDNGPYSGSAYVFDIGGPGCVGDLDGDGDTDHADLGILLADWGCDDPVNGCAGDLNGDDQTNHADLGIILADWGCGL